MTQTQIVNSGLGTGVVLVTAGVGGRYGWEFGAIAAGLMIFGCTVWVVSMIRGR